MEARVHERCAWVEGAQVEKRVRVCGQEGREGGEGFKVSRRHVVWRIRAVESMTDDFVSAVNVLYQLDPASLDDTMYQSEDEVRWSSRGDSPRKQQHRNQCSDYALPLLTVQNSCRSTCILSLQHQYPCRTNRGYIASLIALHRPTPPPLSLTVMPRISERVLFSLTRPRSNTTIDASTITNYPSPVVSRNARRAD